MACGLDGVLMGRTPARPLAEFARGARAGARLAHKLQAWVDCLPSHWVRIS